MPSQPNQWHEIVGEDSHAIRQDARLVAATLAAGKELSFGITGRAAYVHVARGKVHIDGETLIGGDAFITEDAGTGTITAEKDGEVLWFDLA